MPKYNHTSDIGETHQLYGIGGQIITMSPPTEITLLLQRGIAAARSGRSGEAVRILEKVIRAEPDNEMAWLWLSGLMTTNEQKRACLEKVLRANPENLYARAGLRRLQDTPPAAADELETRLAFAVGENGSASTAESPTQEAKPTVKPPLKRLTPPRSSNKQPDTVLGNGQVVSRSTEPARPVTPSPSKSEPPEVPETLKSTCPACDEPISPKAQMCPYCFMPLKSLEELLGGETGASTLDPRKSSKRKRKSFFGGFGSVLSA
jgi:hypothetical protein